MSVQIQFGGSGNVQISQDISRSLSSLLATMADALKERTFTSDEVREHFFSRIDKITQLLNENHENTLDRSKYMIFPFKVIAIPESLQNQSYVCSMLDTLSVIAFSETEFEILPSHINIKIAGKNIFGIYYTDGQLNLKDSYIRLLSEMSKKKVHLPGGFVCIPLNTSGEYVLEEKKINNIVINIMGTSDYIKPLSMGAPKCLSLSSYIISDAQNLIEAQTYVREVLGIE